MVSTISVDVDSFRMLNSRRGHDVGGQILAELAHLLQNQLRDFNFLARLGDDRFLAIAKDLSRSQLRSIVTYVDRSAHLQFDQLGLGLDSSLSISTGVACFPEDAGSAETLLLTSYQNLYQEKLSRGQSPLAPGARPCSRCRARRVRARQFPRNSLVGSFPRFRMPLTPQVCPLESDVGWE